MSQQGGKLANRRHARWQNGLPITTGARAPMLLPDLMLSLPLSPSPHNLTVYHPSLCLHTPVSLSPLCLPPLSLSVIRPAVPGAMANHLIPNSLLRPHGTNNPYNTLLGESSIYNNPLGMYNTQGVAALSLSLSLLLLSLNLGGRGSGKDSVFVRTKYCDVMIGLIPTAMTRLDTVM